MKELLSTVKSARLFGSENVEYCPLFLSRLALPSLVYNNSLVIFVPDV